MYRQLSLVWNIGWHVSEVSRLNEEISESPTCHHEKWNCGVHCPNYYESHGSDRGTLNQAWGPFNSATLWDSPGHTSMNPYLAFEEKWTWSIASLHYFSETRTQKASQKYKQVSSTDWQFFCGQSQWLMWKMKESWLKKKNLRTMSKLENQGKRMVWF